MKYLKKIGVIQWLTVVTMLTIAVTALLSRSGSISTLIFAVVSVFLAFMSNRTFLSMVSSSAFENDIETAKALDELQPLVIEMYLCISLCVAPLLFGALYVKAAAVVVGVLAWYVRSRLRKTVSEYQ